MSDQLVPLSDVVRDAPVTVLGRSTDEQVQHGLVEARAVAFAFLRLGATARPELAWRCTRLGQAIEQALDDTFGRMTK